MIIPFKTDEEAIRLANITDFGLSAAVWSRDSSGPVALPAKSSLEWYLSMISPVPIPRTVRRLQGFRVWARTWRSRRSGTYQPKTDLAGCVNKSTRRIPTDARRGPG